MRVLFDEGVPRPLARFLTHHDVSTVPGMSWSGVKNGELLRLIESAKFDVFLSADQNMQAQQNLADRPFAILIMTAVNWPIVRPHAVKISAAVDLATPGTVATIDCGRPKVHSVLELLASQAVLTLSNMSTRSMPTSAR